MKFQLKIINDINYDCVRELVRVSFGFPENSNTNLKKGDFCVIALCDANTVIGHVLVSDIYDPFLNKKSLFLQNICVKESYRNKGIGTMMLKYIEEFAASNDYNEIFFTSNKNKITAHAMYKKNNYVIKDTDLFVKIF